MMGFRTVSLVMISEDIFLGRVESISLLSAAQDLC